MSSERDIGSVSKVAAIQRRYPKNEYRRYSLTRINDCPSN
jgi:hypothetical protein